MTHDELMKLQLTMAPGPFKTHLIIDNSDDKMNVSGSMLTNKLEYVIEFAPLAYKYLDASTKTIQKVLEALEASGEGNSMLCDFLTAMQNDHFIVMRAASHGNAAVMKEIEAQIKAKGRI